MGIATIPTTVIPNFNMSRRLKYFDLIIVSGEIGHEKITGIPFKIALEKMGLTPEEVIVVGDRSDEDMYGAHLLDIRTIKFNFGYWKDRWYQKTAIPDFVITQLSEVLDIIKHINKSEPCK